MSQLIELNIDLSKIDKSKIYKGTPGKQYYKIIVSVNDDVDKFDNDVSVYEKQSDEERDAKANKNFLGNGKTFWAKDAKTYKEKGGGSQKQEGGFTSPDDDDDDLPF